LLTEVARGDWHHLVETWKGGAIKLALLHRLLEIRQKLPHLFETGDYQPVPVRGASAEHVIAFARRHDGDAIIIAIGRLFASLTDGGRRWPRAVDWQGEIVVEGFEDVERLGPASLPATADGLSLSALFSTVPIAVLRARPAS
jgi:(1->4)-alpha-D-glucan 1-alpha-D-glucosylmutase